MTFEDEMYEIMTSDPSINELVDVISYQNLPDNWLGGDTDNHWIAYDIRRIAQTDCIEFKNIFMTFQVSIVVIQRGINTNIDTITNLLINYLNNYSSPTIIDIKFLNDQLSFNQQQNIYTNSLEFECIYVE
jgi:hypothetical protein